MEDERTVSLESDDGVQYEVQRHLFPVGAREGSVLRIPLENELPVWSQAVLDEAERQQRDAEDRNRLDLLRRRDKGGYVEL